MANYKLCFYVPTAQCETVKSALFALGVGQMGNYDCCAWQTQGVGQFRPLAGSQPAIGSQDTLEQIAEMKVEMLCPESLIKQAVETLRKVHPYETPAYNVWLLADF